MLSRSFLMNDFLESFLLIFGKNKYTNLKRYIEQFFVTKQIQSLKGSKNYSFEDNDYKALTKYI